MGKQSQRSSFDKDCAINEFKNRWAIYFASDEGRRDCTCRGSFIVEVEKLCGDVFADCVNRAQAASPDWDCIRLAVIMKDACFRLYLLRLSILQRHASLIFTGISNGAYSRSMKRF